MKGLYKKIIVVLVLFVSFSLWGLACQDKKDDDRQNNLEPPTNVVVTVDQNLTSVVAGTQLSFVVDYKHPNKATQKVKIEWTQDEGVTWTNGAKVYPTTPSLVGTLKVQARVSSIDDNQNASKATLSNVASVQVTAPPVSSIEIVGKAILAADQDYLELTATLLPLGSTGQVEWQKISGDPQGKVKLSDTQELTVIIERSRPFDEQEEIEFVIEVVLLSNQSISSTKKIKVQFRQ